MKKYAALIAVAVLFALAAPALASTNPFMDVPMNHWAYDAIGQLAARGVLSGYPDGTYKGKQPTTRYEMASALARALAVVDMTKASKQDVEMLKKLIIEFKDELDALGVKVDRLDDRVAVLETDIGGWSMSGQLRFDARFGTDDNDGAWYGNSGKNEFDLNRYRFWIRKRINETTSFVARLGADGVNGDSKNVKWDWYSITTKLPYDISLTVGRNEFDWEDQLGLYTNNDAMFGDIQMNMFRFQKDWGMANLELVIGRLDDGNTYEYRIPNTKRPMTPDDDATETVAINEEHFMIAGLANFNINEKFRAGVMGYYQIADDDHPAHVAYYRDGTRKGDYAEGDSDLLTVGVYAGFNFTPAIELKGIYYFQDQGDTYRYLKGDTSRTPLNEDDANAWKVILDVKQEALKFTSLWLEYANVDNNFAEMPTTYRAIGAGGANLLANKPFNAETTKVYGVTAKQQWNDKWRTFLHYYVADHDTANVDDAKNWALGVAYRLNPAVEFELLYDNIDYGNGTAQDRQDDDHIIRFRTFVTF